MPRTEMENQRLRESARARILAGARTAFARRGPAATMADVATAAGVSQGLPYRYFRDKAELIRALVAEVVGHAGAAPDDGPRAATAGDRLRRLVTDLVEARRAQPEIFALLDPIVRDQTTPPELLELVAARGREVVATLRELVVAAQVDGEVAPDDPDQLVVALMACLDGLTRFVAAYPDQALTDFPDPAIVMRLFAPPSPKADRRR